MAQNNDYTQEIQKIDRLITKLFKNAKAWRTQDETIIELYKVYYQAIYAQVYMVLDPQKT
ncbi:MAG: hypothetical protein J6Q67_00390 [Clostridia bacterium]|nr:hypothetical protein [Clostridia bacterium]